MSKAKTRAAMNRCTPKKASRDRVAVSAPDVPLYLGIEIGGTKLQLGLGPGDGTLAGLWRSGVDLHAGPEGIRKQILQAVPELLGQTGVPRSRLAAVGIGFGGPVDDATRSVLTSHQVGGWDGFPLADWIGQQLALPAVLGNDADVAGLAETCFGAGKGLSPVFYITVGSGIGGGLIVDGAIYRGSGRGAAEIGHVMVAAEEDGKISRRPLELWASGWAIAEQARQALAADGAATAEDVARAAARGNRLAQAMLDRAWDCLAEAICHVIVLVCPRRVVIGGGVSLMGEQLLFEPLRAKVAARVFRPFAGLCEIVPAALGEEVVVHGALALARHSSRSARVS
jgi:glucokinase